MRSLRAPPTRDSQSRIRITPPRPSISFLPTRRAMTWDRGVRRSPPTDSWQNFWLRRHSTDRHRFKARLALLRMFLSVSSRCAGSPTSAANSASSIKFVGGFRLRELAERVVDIQIGDEIGSKSLGFYRGDYRFVVLI